ncbi:stalk domain-containing protein [Alkaliphilus peptidifermentans]|uniref:PrcB C-terminal n=1 Tax=Alkaliphilus peptidifermentans DSM 18978 TaxID=1120976 RepID=A0A1G5KMB3_9FIRM|nr:stalk domain-containing protein [Alkaliphilus peptidifermentans]SCZ01767.1 PrcB C-terminal [Alkaliphilus peptidifermentans DSM 18978]
MIRSKYSKALVAGICFSVISSSVVFANPYDVESGTMRKIEIAIEDRYDLYERHQEIDNYLFKENVDKIVEWGFVVTHTGPMDEYIEIGITPYNEENADYLYAVFGRDDVKVVEGHQAVTLPIDITNRIIDREMYSGHELAERHWKIDNFVFEKYAEKIQAYGFSVTSTGPMDDYIEIGIIPYNEDNANYLYDIIGRDEVKIVEGIQAVTLPVEINDNIKINDLDQPVSSTDQDRIIRDTNTIGNKDFKQEPGILIYIDGEQPELDAMPIIENNRTLIPVRGVMEKMGANVEWDGEENAVKVIMDDVSILLHIGQDTAVITRDIDKEQVLETINLDVPAKIIEGRTFIPGRFVAEALGAIVGWNDENRSVIIQTQNKGDIISVERPIDFEKAMDYMIVENDELMDWYLENINEEGVHSLTDGKWKHVLISAGEKPSGGYELNVESVTEVTPGTAYIYATLVSPEEGVPVTDAITYPHALIRFEGNSIEKLQWDITDINQGNGGISIEDEVGESLLEMEKGISIESIKDMKLYSLMQEEIKEFSQDEIVEIINHLNTGATYNGAYITMLAGNSIKITLEDEGELQLTSFGSKDYVIVSGALNGEFVSYCIISPEVGSILLDLTEE